MFRTMMKEEGILFFVPSYVKCVRMMGGLNDKEITNICEGTHEDEGYHFMSKEFFFFLLKKKIS